jgi:hypothetical protein
METLEGTQGVHTEKVILSRLATNIQDSLVCSIQFCCEHAVRTTKVMGEHLALINKGKISRTVKQRPISADWSIVRAVIQTVGKEPVICMGWCVAFHVFEEPKIAGQSYDMPRWKRRESNEATRDKRIVRRWIRFLKRTLMGWGVASHNSHLLLYARLKTATYDGWSG